MASMISVYAWLQEYISSFKVIKYFNANRFVAENCSGPPTQKHKGVRPVKSKPKIFQSLLCLKIDATFHIRLNLCDIYICKIWLLGHFAPNFYFN